MPGVKLFKSLNPFSLIEKELSLKRKNSYKIHSLPHISEQGEQWPKSSMEKFNYAYVCEDKATSKEENEVYCCTQWYSH